MSGFVGILRTDGAAVEPALIEDLTAAQAFRGPDGRHTWCGEAVALGHTLLRTTHESKNDHQPLSLDGRVFIVADGRVDARRELVRALVGEAESTLLAAPDAELILRAYLQWGEGSVKRLLGDFAFAIWDGPRRRLFCARDHMGVKPFYYACVGGSIIVASTLEAIRRHPQVSERLNDLAIADFLLFGWNQDAATSSFADVQRLPPAHTLTSTGRALKICRYWSLPIDEPLYLHKDRDYVDQYLEVVQQAVSDRLRTDRVSIFMSGGLDSSGLAASALEALGEATPQPVKAFTFVYDSLIIDSEREYAGLVARHLRIPISFYALDEDAWLPATAAEIPEPSAALTDLRTVKRAYADMAAHSRVALYGEGPDNALSYEWQPQLRYLLTKRRYGRLAADVTKHLVAHRRVPLVPTIPRMILDKRTRHDVTPSFPAWLPAETVNRLQLKDRWHAFHTFAQSDHPVRPRAYRSLLGAQWQCLFETLEPSYTGVPLEVRHPYVDIRVLRFLLRVPAMPWCRIKRIQREALRGIVPEAVRRRPKTPLAGHPDLERCRRFGLPPLHGRGVPAMYGDPRRLRVSEGFAAVEAELRFISLSHWLAAGGSTTISAKKEESHGQAVTDAGRR